MNRATLFIAAAFALACSEAADPNNTTNTSTTTSGAGASSASATTATTTTGSAGSTGVGGGGLEGLVINEIAADDQDWVELFNTGTAPVDLTGVRITDDDAGMPSLAAGDPVDLTGAVVEPGAYLFILADLMTPGAGEQTMCDPDPVDPAPPPATCYHAGWGVTQGGDVIYLVGAGDAILVQQAYPMDGAIYPQTWGRLPNGTGDFAANLPTPAAENMAP